MTTTVLPQAFPTPSKGKYYRPKPRQHDCLTLLQLSTHLKEALQIHAIIIKSSLSDDPYFAGRLCEFYAFSEDGLNVPYAEKVLKTLQNPPLFAYNTLIRAYFNCKNPLESLYLYRQALLQCTDPPDHFTCTFALKACTKLDFGLNIGLQIHCQAVKSGLDSNPHVRNKLIHLYSSCGYIADARKVFDESSNLDIVAWNSMLQAYADVKDGETLQELFNNMPCRDAVSWNSMIGYCTEMGKFDEAITMLRNMQECKECMPNRITMINVLSSICHMSGLSQGKWIHAYIIQKRIELDDNLTSALINMYSKCGCIECAVDTFKSSGKRSIDTWNAMMAGYTTNGLSSEAIDLFYMMECTPNLKPNFITFACVLNACSHGGLVEEGIMLFNKMKEVYKINPDICHYGCMVDLFSRAGMFEKAEAIMNGMPMEPDVVMWKALVGACRIHGNFELGKKAGRKLIEVAPKDHASYVLLSNIYALCNDWNGVGEVRKMMASKGVKKVPGCSSIELDGDVHEFIAGDGKNERKKEIYEMMVEMGEKLRMEGYEPDTKQVLLDIEEEEVKESSLSHHSEKLAIAFGLIRSRPGTVIRVVKNLRVCGDCHAAIKVLSRVYGREIVVRDSNRYHRFREGECSCKDYW